MTRKWLALFLSTLLLLLPAVSQAATIVTSFYPIYLFALNLADGIDGLSVHNLAAPDTGCLHDYQLTARDLVTISSADVLLINGAGMENYLEMVTDAYPAMPVVDASAGIDLLPSVTGETEYNAHIWLDPQNAILMVRNLASGMMDVMPDYADSIQSNCEAYIRRLEALDTTLRTGLTNLRRTQIVTFHEAFPYFARSYGLEVAAVVANEPDEPISTAELLRLIDLVNELDDPPLFSEPQFSVLAAQTIAAQTGAPLYALDPCVTGPETDIPLTYYEDVMLSNLEVLQKALR